MQPSKSTVKQLGIVAICSECEAVYTGKKLTMNTILPCGHKPKGFMEPSLIGSNLRDAQLLAWAYEHAPEAFRMLMESLEEAGGAFEIECTGQERLRLPDYVIETEPACRVCGCTESRACLGGCWWVEDDLCSTCHTAIRKGTLTEAQFESLTTEERIIYMARAKRVSVTHITRYIRGKFVSRYMPRIRSFNWSCSERFVSFVDWRTPERARRAGERMLSEWQRLSEEQRSRHA